MIETEQKGEKHDVTKKKCKDKLTLHYCELIREKEIE